MAEKIFMDGLRFWKKRDTAPEFVLGTLVITPADLAAWVAANPQYLTEYEGKKQVKIQVTKGQEGKLVFAVDTWKPEPKAETAKPAKAEEDQSLPF